MIYILTESNPRFWMARLMHRWSGEIAYIVFGVSGLKAEIEFPSDWHERKMGWVRLGFGLFRIGVAFPWKWVVPDEHQCSGPTYGFTFFARELHLHWGKCKGLSSDPMKVIYMPWDWHHVRHTILNPDGSICCDAKSLKHSWEPPKEVIAVHDYTYHLKSGEEQHRKATIFGEEREWRWHWFQWLSYPKLVNRSINIDFDGEVGERSGSWKGGTTGCSYEWKSGETQLECLRRMEKERDF